ncbi:unnamed protein product [Pleuronectes platessa]|uniref:Uncharacterized protein n=1 Tax=Pleuronectes platessa TaxID=8262 RepID=A0A9N7VWD6_PLEPL|nr:unnamed protein product [Pleuronectes platessa]
MPFATTPRDMKCCRRNDAGDQMQTLQRLKESKQERMTTEDGKSRFQKLENLKEMDAFPPPCGLEGDAGAYANSLIPVSGDSCSGYRSPRSCLLPAGRGGHLI